MRQKPVSWPGVFFRTGVTALCLMAVARGGAEPPSFQSVRASHPGSDALLLDRDGLALQQWRLDHHGRQLRWTALKEISPALTRTVIAIEDRRFREHHGVDWWAVLGSAWSRLTDQTSRGASTLTMQLAALLDPALRPTATRRSWREKWAQMEAARALEKTWSKEEILEAYLNLVTFRGELRGIDAASRALFDKHPSGIGMAEALLLTVLVRSPNTPAKAAANRACTLAQDIAPEVACDRLRELAASQLTGAPGPIRPEASWAPHAARKLWREHPDSSSRRVRSTLDGSLQRFAVDALVRQLARLRENTVRDGAVLVVDNASGEVLAYVGNGGHQSENRHVDGVLALRQAGSTLKPFLYELALEQRILTAASLLEDAPLELPVPSGLYAPRNHDESYRGWISARTALASSLNIPAVRVLLLTGLEPWAMRLRRLGFAGVTEDGAHYGYGLALGSAEVTLWQLVDAYRTLADGGHHRPLSLLPTEPSPPDRRIMEEAAVFVVNDILSDPVARSLTFGLDSPLATPFWSAAKTGTSKQMRDNWCLGFSQRHTVGVWMGNFDGEPMAEVSGVTGAAPLWLEIMTFLDRSRSGAFPSPPPPPKGVEQGGVTFRPALEPPRREWFLAGTRMARVQLKNPEHQPVRILYPPDGSILALDPDIPPERQKVFFRVTSDQSTAGWRLDGGALSSIQEGWTPVRGSHRLEWIHNNGQQLDAVSFQVRGGRQRSEK